MYSAATTLLEDADCAVLVTAPGEYRVWRGGALGPPAGSATEAILAWLVAPDFSQGAQLAGRPHKPGLASATLAPASISADCLGEFLPGAGEAPGVLEAGQQPGGGEAARLTAAAREDLRDLARRHVAAAHRACEAGDLARAEYEFYQRAAIMDMFLGDDLRGGRAS